MNQADLNREVACITGETVSTIKRLGFLLANPADNLDDDLDEQSPLVIDWDELEAERDEQNQWSPQYEPAAA